MLNSLFLDMNSYFATVEQQLQPQLRCRPVVVAPVTSDSGCCIAASPEAKQSGIRTGTRVGEARKLCPEVTVVDARPAIYVAFHEKIVKCVEKVIPDPVVYSIDEMAFPLTGWMRDESRAVDLAIGTKQAIRRDVGDYLTCSIGIAPNRFLAKTGTEMQKPDGLVVLRQSELPDSLYSLRLSDLCGIGRRMHARLASAGVHTVEQLCRQSVDRMRHIWGGVVGEKWFRQLRGEVIPENATTRRSVGHSHVLAPRLRTPEGTFNVSMKLLHKAAARLRAMKFWAQRVEIAVTFQRGVPQSGWGNSSKGGWGGVINLPPTRDTGTFVRVVRDFWREHWSRAPRCSPLKAAITLQGLTANANVPGTLFEEDRSRERLSDTMDRINTLFGPHTVYLATMQLAGDSAAVRIPFNRIPDLSKEVSPSERKSIAELMDVA